MEVKKIGVKDRAEEARTVGLPGAEYEQGLETVKRLAVRTRGGRLVTLELPREDPMTYMNGAHILFRATAGENTLHLRQQADGFDCIVHWGDGTRTKVPASGGNMIHSYARAGDYHIFVTGEAFAGFYVKEQPGAEKYIAAYSMGRWKRDTMTSASYSFQGCVNLEELGNDLFRYQTKIETFYCCFQSCMNLTELPEGLFRYNLKAYGFGYCFSSCPKLALRGDIFGTGNETTRFAHIDWVDLFRCFKREIDGGDQGTAPALWNYTFRSVVKDECFGGDGNNEDTLSNYGEIPAAWKEGPTA